MTPTTTAPIGRVGPVTWRLPRRGVCPGQGRRGRPRASAADDPPV